MQEENTKNAVVHKTVLLQEAIDSLDMKAGDIFVDGTLGNGGHTEEVVKRFGNKVKIFAIDADSDAILRAEKRLAPLSGDITYILGNFRNMDELLQSHQLDSRFRGNDEGWVNAILLDIGMSSNQLEESGRGFAFRTDEPLKMSFQKDVGEGDWTAERIVNTWDEDSLRTIIKSYGEENFAGCIAKGIVKARGLAPIKTTTDLVNVILASTPAVYHRGRLHPATRTFQALRITVNDELQVLSDGLTKGFGLLKSDGRIAVISFHSLEDRIVKNYFKTMEATGFGKRVTKKPVTPTSEEIEANPRSRSAKLRVFQKI